MRMRVFARIVMALATVCPALSSGPAAADPITFMAYAAPPYSADDGSGKLVGPAVDLCVELAKAAGIDAKVELQPFARLITTLNEGNGIAVLLGRTEERELKYTWIAQVYLDGLAFSTIKPNLPVDSLDMAKTLESVAVLSQAAPAAILQMNGLTNLYASNKDGLSAKMLEAGRVKAWFGPAGVMRWAWRSENLDPAVLQIGKTIAPASLWIAASKNIPDDTIQKMKARYEVMKADGSYDRIISVLK